jgi:hypothetical protein
MGATYTSGVTAVLVKLMVPEEVMGPPVRPVPVSTLVTVPDPPPPVAERVPEKKFTLNPDPMIKGPFTP